MVIKVIKKKVVFIHTAPNFDTSGMIEVSEIPEPENNGMIAELFWDNGFYYEYHNHPEEVEEKEEVGAIQQPKISYDQLVSDLIREKYTVDKELAINRQRDTKPEEFQEYFDFCEQCKIKAHEAII